MEQPTNPARQSRRGSLASKNPELIPVWDKEANGELSPDDVVPSSTETVFWICPNGHGSYAMRIYSRVRKSSPGCPACSRSTMMKHLRGPKPETLLGVINPELAAEWDTAANGNLTPMDVNVNSLQKAWWVCPAGHPSFFSRIANRNAGSGCPCCGRRRTISAHSIPAPGKSVAELFPDIAADWDTEANGGLTASDVSAGSGRRMYWKCPKGHGSYASSPTARTSKGAVCPVCAKGNRADLRALPAPGRSLAELRPETAAEWDAAANAPRTPSDVAATSKRVYSWLCPAGHPAYRMRVVDRWHSNSCPVCNPSSADRVVTG